ncbi:MAG TPA: COX15/CtaA family protein [Burkholderiales bacterium]|nr:COX15/CtaA family protein [Burkholderiales bacterium]
MTRGYRLLVLVATLLAFAVVVVGAYVRLSDAGLGCPDWPLCYGHPVPEPVSDAAAHAKAWKEMGHRYIAGTLGLLLCALAGWAWRLRRDRGLTLLLLALVVLQATLGKWTVTMLLRPAVVTSHLLGGMAIFALLVLLCLRQGSYAPAPRARAARPAALASLLLLAVQIALGGWVSANYAGLACPDLPGCRGALLPAMDFGSAFHVVRELGRTAEGALLSNEALTAIHWTHRVFALAVLCVALATAARAYRLEGLRIPALAVAALVALQFLLGVLNVAFSLPLPLADAHNAGAALLLASLVVLNFFSFRGLRPFR